MRSIHIHRLLANESFRAGLILVFVLHLCFGPCIWGTKTLLESARDVPSIMPQGAWAGKRLVLSSPKVLDAGAPGWQSEPLLGLLHYQYLHEKTIPLWNPYQGYGRPLAADMLSQPFFPLTAGLSLILSPKTYSWYVLLRLFIAGLCAYLYLRLFVSNVAALAGGITSMLAGYYVLYITMFHLSVETLIPAGLFSAEYLVRRPTFKTSMWFAVVIVLVLLGGMPESSLVLLTFVYCYLLFRIVTDPSVRSNGSGVAKYLTVSTIAGIALSAFLLLPFWEFLRLCFDTHQPSNLGGIVRGLGHDAFGASIFTYLFPLFLGPPQGKPGWTGIRNYTGLISIFLVFVALAASRKKTKNDHALRSLTWFYVSFLIIVLLKRYGFPAVNWIGAFPLYRFMDFPKYDEAILSICVAILCSIGVERLMRRDVSIRAQAIVCAITFLLIPVTAVCCWTNLLTGVVVDEYVSHRLPVFSLALPTLLLIAVAAVLFSWNRQEIGSGRGAITGTCVVVVLTLEASLSYIVPTYYHISRLAGDASNPYTGAPFIDVLNERAGRYRIFARDGLLFPDWASSFELSDIRDVDAMYYKKYLPFIRAFLPATNTAVRQNVNDRFTGAGSYEFDDPLERRLLQLSSVKWVSTLRVYPIPNHMVDQILEENRGHIEPGREVQITKRSFALGGVAREGLGEHPPYGRLPYTVHVGRNQARFHFAYGIDPAVFDKGVGDGVGFTIEVKDPADRISKVFSSYIDPKHDPNERRWMKGEIDLSRYRGRTIQLLLSTDPGPRGDTAYDWAAWSDFHFDDVSEDGDQPFKPIYQGEALVYKYDDVLPRAALYYRADIRNGESDVLRRLEDPSLDIFNSVVVNASDLSGEQRRGIAVLNEASPKRVDATPITRYKSQEVEIAAALNRTGILVLNDSDYPGWTVDVDGHRSKWFTANYMFRGVLLPAGKHIVRFTYKPISFYLGAAISCVALLILVTFGFLQTRSRPCAVDADQ